MCDECQGLHCGGRYAPYFCGNIHCLRYYCEHCWSAIHSAPGTQNHRCFIKENGDRPRAINFFPTQPRVTLSWIDRGKWGKKRFSYSCPVGTTCSLSLSRWLLAILRIPRLSGFIIYFTQIFNPPPLSIRGKKKKLLLNLFFNDSRK